MFNRIITVIGWAVVAIMATGLGFGMVIAVANSTM